jgi:Tol biopolymer transport system component
MRRLLGLVVAALAATLLISGSAQATFPGKNGKIALETFDRDTLVRSFYTIAPDGSGARLIPSYRSGHGRWSPDGTKLAYQAGLPDGCCHWSPTIEVVNADGSGHVTLADDEIVDAPGLAWHTLSGWSPDGRQLLFSRSVYNKHTGGEPGDVFTMNSDGSGYTRRTDGGCCTGSRDPVWSSDSGRIAFDSAPNGAGDQLFVMGADGSRQTQITTDGGALPAWSPVGDRIAYVRCCDSQIYEISADGSGETRLTSFPGGTVSSLSWSPGGTRLLFAHSGDIYVMNGDGSGLVKLTDNGRSYAPVWSPDRQKIAFSVQTSPDPYPYESDLYVMNADGSGQTRIASFPGTNVANDWQPIPGPKRADYKNGTQFCKAEQVFWGDQFGQRYRNFGQCVRGR